MRIVMLLFPDLTHLDAFGPYHALAHLPGHEFLFVAERRGLLQDSSRIRIEVDAAIDEVPECDVLVVPGGIPAITMARTGHVLVDWIRQVHPATTWTTSVCTGALMLGAAGALEGRRATTHWYCHDDLRDYGAIPTAERVVSDGNVITAAGVSAGIDMALLLSAHLVGEPYAQATQLDMEYAPEPPFAAGSPDTAPPEVTAWVRSMYDSMLRGDHDMSALPPLA